MKILVADDSRFYRNTLRSLLESWGYEVALASDGYEAQSALDGDDAPRMAILDCLMPGLSGLEICERIRGRKQGYVYTILLSAADRDSDVLKGFELGADDYLCKPFKELELRTRLKVGERIIRSQEELVEAHEALKFEASHDFLVRIWNRRAIVELLKTELGRAKRLQTSLSVLLADLDRFKRINDTYGHSVGDDVLRCAGERLAGSLREYDHVGRFGGEEFLMVLPYCDAELAWEVAERVRQNMEEPMVEEMKLEITVSIGIAEWRAGQEINDLLRLADVAMYRAKKNGRNRVEIENAGEADSR